MTILNTLSSEMEFQRAEKETFADLVANAIYRGDVNALIVLYRDSLKYGEYGKDIRIEIDNAAYIIARKASIPLTQIAFRDVVNKKDEMQMLGFLKQGEVDLVVSFIEKPAYARAMVQLLEQQVFLHAKDLAKVLYGLIKLATKNASFDRELQTILINPYNCLQSRNDEIVSKVLDTYIELGELISNQSDRAVWNYLQEERVTFKNHESALEAIKRGFTVTF